MALEEPPKIKMGFFGNNTGITHLSGWIYTSLLASFCIGGTIALALCAYAVGHYFLPSKADQQSKDLAGSIIFRVAALHGLILALVFAQELVNLNEVRTTVAREATLAGDVFYDLKRFDDEKTKSIRQEMASYIVAVKDQEWSRLGERKGLDPQIWKMWQNVYHHILDLNPSTPRQTALRATLLADIRQISGLRRIRENASNNGLNPLFLFAALIGIVLTGIAYFTFIPNFVTLTLISIFGAYTGLVLFFIVAFSNPFAPPGNISPSAFKSLVAGEIQKLANSPSDRP